jgi:hypothetical protein
MVKILELVENTVVGGVFNRAVKEVLSANFTIFDRIEIRRVSPR